MGKNADHVAALRERNLRNPLTRIYGAVGGGVTSDGGQSAQVKTISSLRVDDDGNIIAEERRDCVSQNGRISQVGRSVTHNLGRVGTQTTVARDSDTGRSQVRVMTGVRYDMETHQLIAQMSLVVIRSGVLSLVPDGEDVITSAVEETVVT